VSLFLEKIPNDRTCDEIEIPAYFCSCLRYYDVPQNKYSGVESSISGIYTTRLIQEMSKNILQQINSESYSSYTNFRGQICLKVSLDKILEVNYQKLSPNRQYFKLVLSVNESVFARFEAVVMLVNVWLKPRGPSEGYEVAPFYLGGRRVLRLMYIKRTDAYAGLCEEFCRARQLHAPLCVC
jgi:hypothetical protein